MSLSLAYERPEERRNWTLADQAAAINKEFERLDSALERKEKLECDAGKAGGTANRARWNAGLALIEARRMLKEENPKASFEAWCAENIVGRNMRACYRCMAIAGSNDPEKALWDEKASWRDEKAQKRAAGRKDDRSGQQSHSVKIVIGMCRKMTPDERHEVRRALEEMDDHEETDEARVDERRGARGRAGQNDRQDAEGRSD
jgi:hypothetical protein